MVVFADFCVSGVPLLGLMAGFLPPFLLKRAHFACQASASASDERSCWPRDPGLRPLDPDSADEQSHTRLLLGEDMFYLHPNSRLRAVAAGDMRWHRLAPRLPVMNAAAPAMPRQPCLIGRRATGRVRHTSDAVLAGSISPSRNRAPSCAAASVTFIRRMRPWRRSMLT